MTIEADHDIEDDDKVVGKEAEAEERGETEQAEEKPQTVEDIARELGWKSPKEWKGKPPSGGHLTPAQYIAQQNQAGVKARSEVKRLSTQMAGWDETHRESLRRQRANIEAQYKRERAELVKAGDVEAIDKLDGLRDKALEQVKEPPRNQTVTADEVADQIIGNPIAEGFYQRNAWLLDDSDPEAVGAFNWAGEMADYLARQGANDAVIFRKVENELKATFGDRYVVKKPAVEEDEEEPQGRRQRITVTPERGGRSSGNSWASKLTAEEARIADSDIKEGLYADREEWARVLFKNRGENV